MVMSGRLLLTGTDIKTMSSSCCCCAPCPPRRSILFTTALQHGQVLAVRVHVSMHAKQKRWPHEHYLVRRKGEAMGPVAEFLYERLRQNLHQGTKTND